MAFADHAAKMDAQVDTRLGDRLFYKRASEPAAVSRNGFLIFDEPVDGYQGRDTAKGIIRLKIAKTIFGTGKPSMNDRITSPLLEGTHRPLGPEAISAGRYWLVDLQKV